MATNDNEAPVADLDMNDEPASSRPEAPEARMDMDTGAAGPQLAKGEGPSAADDDDEMRDMQDPQQSYATGANDKPNTGEQEMNNESADQQMQDDVVDEHHKDHQQPEQ